MFLLGGNVCRGGMISGHLKGWLVIVGRFLVDIWGGCGKIVI